MSRYGTPYQTCTKLQKSLESNIMAGKNKPRDVICCVKSWLELEYFKREIRGIPRLKPAELRDVLDTHMKRARRAITDHQPIEADISTEMAGG
jgi:hypothetical protein